MIFFLSLKGRSSSPFKFRAVLVFLKKEEHYSPIFDLQNFFQCSSLELLDSQNGFKFDKGPILIYSTEKEYLGITKNLKFLKDNEFLR